MENINPWKIATIILAVIAITLLFIPNFNVETYNLGDFKIPQKNLNNFGEFFGNQQFVICDLINNKCVYIKQRE